MKKFFTLVILCLFCAVQAALAQLSPDDSILSSKIMHRGSFIKNEGQWTAKVLYHAQSPNWGAGVSFLKNKLIFVSTFEDEEEEEEEHENPGEEKDLLKELEHVKQSAFSMQFLNANPKAVIRGEIKHDTHYNYYTGSDPSKWVENAPGYEQVVYQDIYPNIDVRYYTSTSHLLEYDYVLKPGALPENISIGFEGIKKLKINKLGSLQVLTEHQTLEERIPEAYQLQGFNKIPIKVAYVLKDKYTLGFKVLSQINPALPIIIDPVVWDWGTFVPGNGYGYYKDIAVDNEKNVVVCGWGVTNPGDTVASVPGLSSFAAISKFSADGSTQLFMTILNGNDADYPTSTCVDKFNNVLVTGFTKSSDFPTTALSYDQIGDQALGEGFYANLDFRGRLRYSTFIGSVNKGEIGYSITVDSLQNAFIFLELQNLDHIGTPQASILGGGYAITKFDSKHQFVALAYLSLAVRSEGFMIDTYGNVCGIGVLNYNNYFFKIKNNLSSYILQTPLPSGRLSALHCTKDNYYCLISASPNGNYLASSGVYQGVRPANGVSIPLLLKLSTSGSTIEKSTYCLPDTSLQMSLYSIAALGKKVFFSGYYRNKADYKFPQCSMGQKIKFDRINAFIIAMDTDFKEMLYADNIGGNMADYNDPVIAVSPQNCGAVINMVLTTHSPNFPATPGAALIAKPSGQTDDPAVLQFSSKLAANFMATVQSDSCKVYLNEEATKCYFGTLDSLRWYISDGTTSSEKNFSHQFAKDGTYDIKLVVGNACIKDSITKSVTVSCSVILPLELLHFTATKAANKAIINWSTASEPDLDYFILERKIIDGQFEQIAQVFAGRQPITKQDYQYTDNKISQKGFYYYRLKLVSKKGTYKYSNTAVLYMDALNEIYVSKDQNQLQLYIGNQNNEAMKVNIVNVCGQVLQSYQISNSSKPLIFTPDLQPGVYFITIYSPVSMARTIPIIW